MCACSSGVAGSATAQGHHVPVVGDRHVITVCDHAAGEVCPIWPGHPATAHWGYADPSQTSGSAEDMEAAFRSTLHQLHKRLESFINLPIESFDQQALQTQARSLSHT